MSVLEVARLTVADGKQDLFETAFAQALPYVRAAKGHLDSSLNRVVGESSDYVLLVRWDTLEDHVEGFATSADFDEFIGLVKDYFTKAPVVAHFAEIDE